MRTRRKYDPPRYHDPNDKKMVKIIRGTRRPRKDAMNILGIPYDGAVLGRRGAAEGPAAIRRGMSVFSNYNIELGLSIEDAKIFDLGDLVLKRNDVIGVHKEIESEVARDLNRSSMLMLLGGDNSISLPSLKAFGDAFGKIGLVVIDSHLDLREKLGGKPTSGSSYGLAIEAIPGLDPERVVEIGAHGFLNSRKYAQKAKTLGIQVVTATEVRENGAAVIARKAYSVAADGAMQVYVSVDIDAVDLSYVSGVSSPSAGGISSTELFELVYELTRGEKTKCVDIVELAPPLDPTGKSQIVASTALMYMIAGFHSRS